MNYMQGNPVWTKNVVRLVFDYRYLVSIVIVLFILGTGSYLYFYGGWNARDVADVCTGAFIVLTLFFTALSFEFSSSKMKQDYKAARELLTFTTANEWYKGPLNRYQKISIAFERQFIASGRVRTANDFERFITHLSRLDFRESLKGILNYFETVSIGVKKGLIDETFIKEFFLGVFQMFYRKYFFYIEHKRMTKNDNTIWINYTSLVEEWHPEIRNKMDTKMLMSTLINQG